MAEPIPRRAGTHALVALALLAGPALLAPTNPSVTQESSLVRDDPGVPTSHPPLPLNLCSKITSPALHPCEEAPTTNFANDPTGLVNGWSTMILEVAISVDQEYVQAHGQGWEAAANATLDEVRALYEDNLDITIEVVDQHSHDATVFPGTTTDGLKGDLSSHYGGEHEDLTREVTYHLTGKTPGSYLGKADQATAPGAYAWGIGANRDPVTIAGPSRFLADHYVEIAAHEIGHTLSASHEYANCGESLPTYDPLAPFDTCTLMFPVADHIALAFSSINVLAIRGHAEDHGL